MGAFSEALSRVYNTREAFFTAVSEAGFGDAADDALSRARASTPPSDLAEDHELWLEFRSELNELDLETAMEQRDLHEILAVFTAAEQSLGSFLSNLSREFCLSAAQRDTDLCPAGDDLVGGGYGQAAHGILRDYQLSTFGLFIFPPGMSPDERALRLEAVQPEIEQALMSAGEALSDLDPPPELAEDHAAFVRFFDEQYETAVAITEANAARDDARVLELFDQSSVVFQRVVDALSADFEPIAAPFFAQ